MVPTNSCSNHSILSPPKLPVTIVFVIPMVFLLTTITVGSASATVKPLEKVVEQRLGPMNTGKCERLYYGFVDDQNLEKALDCFKKRGKKELVAIMHANGEGTEQNLEKARQLASSLRNSRQQEAIEKAIEELKQGKRERIRYCEKIDNTPVIANTTFSIEYCGVIWGVKLDVKIYEQLNDLVDGLKGDTKTQLLDLVDRWEKLLSKDSTWVHKSYAKGSMRGIATAGHRRRLKQNFLSHMKLLKTKELQKSIAEEAFKEGDIASVEKRTTQKLENKFQTLLNDFRDRMDAVYLENSREEFVEWYRKLPQDLQQAHQIWKQFRESMLDFLSKLHNINRESDILRTIKIKLIKQRIESYEAQAH